MTQKKSNRKAGRPAGSRNVPREAVIVQPSRCPRCGSTDREAYRQTTEQAHAGQTADGEPYTHVVRRWCKCRACGQARIDITRENRASPSHKSPDLSAGS